MIYYEEAGAGDVIVLLHALEFNAILLGFLRSAARRAG